MTKLYVIEGPEKGTSFDLKGEVFFLGRRTENDIQIKDSSVSGRHLRIEREGKQFFIVDLHSTNGTYLNGRMIKPGERVEVKEGLPIAVGATLICFEEEFSLGGTLVTHAVRFPGRFGEKRKKPSWNRDQLATSAQNLKLIYKFSNVLMQSFDVNEILQKIIDILFESLKRLDRGAVLLLDENTGELSEVIARSRKGDNDTTIRYSRTIVDHVISDAKPVMMSDTSEEEEVKLSDSMKGMDIRSVMCVPLISRSKIRGAIYVDSVRAPHGFRKDDLQLLVALSSPAAIAIENAMLYSNLERLVESRTRSLQATEKSLRESEARFRAIFDNMQSGVIVYEALEEGKNFVIVDFNRAGQRIEKLRKEDVLGKKALEAFPGHAQCGLPEIFRRVWKTGVPEHVPPCVYQDERIHGWREYDIYRLPSGEIVNIYMDITEKKRVESEQKALQKKLLSSLKLESIGRLAGGVAHNFRNILQAILGNVEYLEMIRGHDPEVSEAVGSLNKSVDRGKDLVNSLLQFSKLGDEFEPVVLNLGEVIQETCKMVERLFDKRIRIRLDLEDELFVQGNATLLGQVFMNLFTNARDAMPEGGELTIRARRTAREVMATISDTGHGMDKETMEKIFDPFFTAKEVGMGTGLGLSSVHGIISEHRGNIMVSSTPGKGTTFKLYFPLAKGDEYREPEKGREVMRGRGEKVLVVDDEKSALDSLVAMVNGLGYQAKGADKARKAIAEFSVWRPELVLMDRSMPDMDGVACLREIMNDDPDAKVVIISGYEETGPDGLDESARKQIKGYITKPCGMEELSKTLDGVLHPRPGNDSGRDQERGPSLREQGPKLTEKRN